MQSQRDIHAQKCAPPSYAEAMGHTVVMKDNEQVSSSERQTYDQYAQASSYLPSISGYQQQSNFYPTTSTQQSYIPTCVSNVSGQANSTSPVQYIVHTENVVHRKKWRDRYCGKKITTAVLCFIIIIIIIQWLVIRVV